MFKISAINQSYPHPVTVLIPNGGAKPVEHKFTILFTRKTQDELDELYRRMTPEKLQEGEELLTDDELLEEVVAGWGADVLDAKDVPLEFTPENFTTVKNIFPVRQTLAQAFYDSIKTAKRKN